MKKLIKLLIFTVVSSTVLLISFGVKTYAADDFKELASQFGFEIIGDVEPLFENEGTPELPNVPFNTSFYHTYTKDGFFYGCEDTWRKEKQQHTSSCLVTYFQNKENNSIKGIMYKITSRPYQPGRNWGFMGIGSNGDDFFQDYVEISAELPRNAMILNYSPVAKPTSKTVTTSTNYNISMSLGKSGGTCGINLGSGISNSYVVNDLNILNKSATGNGIYDIVFDFNEKRNVDYVKGEVITYGALIYKYEGRVDFDLNIHIKYHDYNGGEHDLEDVIFIKRIVS